MHASSHAAMRPPTYGTMGGMRKSTVYLPDDLKSKLARAAVESGRSEAELIREGIELVTGRVAGVEPRLPLFESGDPDLAERVDEHLAGFGER
jgi:Arc/MetJ-type ribon-helix-helix transcriptional regulator